MCLKKVGKNQEPYRAKAVKGAPGTTVFALTNVVLDKKVAVKKYGNTNYNNTYLNGVVISALVSS